MARYRKLFFGGFFDHLHAGHREAFRAIAKIPCEQLIVLVASDNRVRERKKTHFEQTQKQEVRVQKVRELLKKLRIKKFRVELFESWPPKQLLDSRSSRDAVVLDSAHIQRARDFNLQRWRTVKPPLAVIPFDYIDMGTSSSKIRRMLALRSRAKRVVARTRARPRPLTKKRKLPVSH